MEIGHLRDEDRALEDGEWVGHLPSLGDAELRVRSATAPVVVCAIGRTLHQLVDTVFKDKKPKMRTTGADGRPTVGRIERVDPQEPAAGEGSTKAP